ncbi:MAG: trypsin-like peptidase domain-containing protein [Ktedonobacteraceae bacterium]|nr:trypsin-like peptidase domain-containing protein [Ktedonobacteraceae bacterium]
MEQATNQTNNVLRTLSNQMADAVERVAPSIVLVNGRQRQPGSGLVYAQDLVLTANHVLERDDNLTIVTHDQRQLAAQLVGRDTSSDLALLRVKDLNLEPVTPSPETARIGQLVIAVGRTSEEGPMASSGVVSVLGGPIRSQRGILLERYIRTDAIPYPGFSGGALIDTAGQVVGLLTTGLLQGAALAIPLQHASSSAQTLAQQGYIKRGYLGISSQFIQLPSGQRAGRTQEYGLLIVKVDEGSPAQQGGVMVGDILVALDGHIIQDIEDLHMLLKGERVGKTIPVEVIRGTAVQTLQVTIRERN